VIAISVPSTSAEAAQCPDQVFINGRCAPSSLLRKLEAAYQTRAVPGRYWYDGKSGLYGYVGQPPLGQMAPNLPFGGKLSPRASAGDTGVFINGRELSRTEVAFLSRLGPVVPGRYWLDAAGNVGIEGSPMPFANLFAAIQRAQPQRRNNGGSTYYGNWKTGTYAGSSGGCSYVSTTSGSVMTGNCD
jgi:hypothetical protein